MNLEKIRDVIKTSLPGYIFLLILSRIYLIALRFRETAYSLGIFNSKRITKPVICFGNISSGGTGKTSTVIMAALELKKMKKRPAIIMRGYKSSLKIKTPLIAGAENSGLDQAGDEATLIHGMLKQEGVPVIVASNRIKAARFALKKFNPDIILMDDGFQHLALKRDLDVVLINASASDNEEVLPLGNMREPFSALKRSSLVILTHCENVPESRLDALKERIMAVNERVLVIESMHVPECFLDAVKGVKLDSLALNGKEAVCVSAIGDPLSFENMLAKLGVRLRKTWRFTDHYRFSMEDIKAIADTCENLPVITTCKDFIRFPRGWNAVITSGLYILHIKVSFLSNGYRVFVNKLMEAVK